MRTPIRCALTLLILATSACYSTKSVALDQAAASKRVSLTLTDQSVVVVVDPKLNDTTLVGLVKGKYTEFPAISVKEAHVRRLHPVRTAGAIAGGVVGLVFILNALPDDAEPGYCQTPQGKNSARCGPGPPFLVHPY